MAITFTKRLASIALLGVLIIGVGCASKQDKLTMTAPEAWDNLQSEADTGVFVGLAASLGSAAGGGPRVDSKAVSSIFEREQKTAESKVDQALSSDLPSEALRSMVAEVAEFFVVELSQVPEVLAADHQFVLAFGEFEAGGNPQMKAAMDGLVAQLFENQEVRNNYFVVTTTESDAAKLIETVSGGDLSTFRDPLQREAVDPTLPAKFDPRFIYLINGVLDAAKDRPNRSVTITMNMELIKPIARETVKKPEFVRTYMWHPYRGNWELQP